MRWDDWKAKLYEDFAAWQARLQILHRADEALDRLEDGLFERDEEEIELVECIERARRMGYKEVYGVDVGGDGKGEGGDLLGGNDV